MPTHAPITLSSPLPAADLFLDALSVSEGLSLLGGMQLNLLSEKGTLAPQDLLGKPVTVTINLGDDSKRYFNGYVTRFGLGKPQGRYFAYQAEVRPWLWFLTRTSDCRIFQEMTVPDIVKKVFDDHASVAHVKLKLFRSYHTWTYCVQYRESDFSFIARLLEREGIYWYFEHTDGKHELVLMDSLSAHDPITGESTIRYIEDPSNAPPDEEYISQWRFSQEVKTGKMVLTSYDFERPGVSLLVDASLSRSHDQASAERFDFQGDYIKTADGKQYAEDWLDEVQARHERLTGEGNAMGLKAGRTFKLSKHPREDQNAQYLLTSVQIQAQVAVFEAGMSGSRFQVSFEAIPAAQQFRPPRSTPKPFVQGPQTAVVVGPGGEEIFTDKYGRVKVQFHWDRLGKKDEKSSCWVRVSQPWAGQNFGFMHIPRIGQEVVVDFLEGDPDQPLITGRVYNAQQMPPWDLPANATQSGVLSRSSKGGAYGNANALRFEDKKGSEQVWLHAEKNQDIEVENDETHWVGHDRTKTIDHDEKVHVKHDRTENVDNNETITIGVDRTERVGKNETITIGVDRKETVGANETITIGTNRTETVGSNETITIGANRSITVGSSETATVAMQRTHTVGINETIAIGAAQEVAIGGAQSITVGALQNVSVGANQSTDVGMNQTLSVGKNQATTVGANQETKVGGSLALEVAKGRVVKIGEDDGLKAGKKIVIEAGDSITLKTGSAELVLKKDGTISINGKDVTIEASGKITAKASSDMVLKGSKIAQN
ncbi:MAG: type VI secretion system tip protein VgrG [Burkholderiales bacterium]|jgi:type VI secretion system secreted protein VgrG|nr:MAG: type VI secretion system tip protein VgrG [Burkholderiales bacterium]